MRVDLRTEKLQFSLAALLLQHDLLFLVLRLVLYQKGKKPQDDIYDTIVNIIQRIIQVCHVCPVITNMKQERINNLLESIAEGNEKNKYSYHTYCQHQV